jgi:hypothetical protein
VPLVVASLSLGGIAGGIFLWFRSWPIFGVAFVAVIALDAFMDFRLRRLDLVEPEV